MTVTPYSDKGPLTFFIDTAASTSEIHSAYLQDGTYAVALDTGGIQVYNGTAWVTPLASAVNITDSGGYTSETTIEAALQELYTYRPLLSVLAADSADIQNDTFTDSGLVLTLPVAGTYHLEAVLPYTAAAAADIQFKFLVGTATVTGTVGVSDIFRWNAPSGDATAAAVPLMVATSWTTAQAITTTGALADANPAVFTGHIVATVAGTVKIQFAQGTTNASNCHVGAGAHFKAQRTA
jgi:predicted secreted protein